MYFEDVEALEAIEDIQEAREGIEARELLSERIPCLAWPDAHCPNPDSHSDEFWEGLFEAPWLLAVRLI